MAEALGLLSILNPGLYTLIVDGGQPPLRRLGVPLGGAADRAALALGNAFVGNPPDAAALEFALAGPTVRADCDLACVVTGAPFELSPPFVVGKTFTLPAGEPLHIGGTRLGMRAYLCVRGGLEKVTRDRIAGPLTLACRPGTIRPRFAPVLMQLWGGPLTPNPSPPQGGEGGQVSPSPPPRGRGVGVREPIALHALPGPQADWFPDQSFWGEPRFRVSLLSNRMGLRLEGDPLPYPERELVSEPVCPGTVQVTRDGRCILLGVDGQTIGGYPKVAQVIRADLDLLGQLRPGEEIRFARVTLEEAGQRYHARQAELRRWLTRLRLYNEAP